MCPPPPLVGIGLRKETCTVVGGRKFGRAGGVLGVRSVLSQASSRGAGITWHWYFLCWFLGPERPRVERTNVRAKTDGRI